MALVHEIMATYLELVGYLTITCALTLACHMEIYWNTLEGFSATINVSYFDHMVISENVRVCNFY